MKCARESHELPGVRRRPKHILLRLLLRHSHTDCLLQKTRMVDWYRRHLAKLGLARLSIVRHTRLEGGRKVGGACKGRRTSIRILSHIFFLNLCVDRITLPNNKGSSATEAFNYDIKRPMHDCMHIAQAVWQEGSFFSSECGD